MELTLLYVLAAGVLALVLLLVSRLRGREQPADREDQRDVASVAARARPQTEERGEGMPRRRRNMNRMMAQRRAQQVEEEEEMEEMVERDEATEVQTSGKIGAKKQKKLEEKQARKAQREAEEAEREERKKLDLKRAEERHREEERLRLEEERQEEEKRKAKEEEEQRQHEEYLKLKESFVVEDEGIEEAMTEEEVCCFLTKFIDYIKTSKVVILEDLGSHFGLRAQDAISRIQDLLSNGTLTGVIDDRGKFIYITPEEMTAVAQFIRQRGRVSITELAQASNSLIKLNSVSAPQAMA
ncbi:DDRGK domain-containing protein 1 [Rhinatrema bivittatum]|uniref:DDRGK domain-containing protein 1 n=1 Tax=Rhinatrema bivittatum TaxID=194408 RepID=UPI00112CF773|nr:DDRGK domain-containing protein 1 [Rhinatrema bivittatum]